MDNIITKVVFLRSILSLWSLSLSLSFNPENKDEASFLPFVTACSYACMTKYSLNTTEDQKYLHFFAYS